MVSSLRTENRELRTFYGSHCPVKRNSYRESRRFFRPLWTRAGVFKSRPNRPGVAGITTLIAKNPDYTPAYFMAAQTLATASRPDEAKRWLVDGISSARRTGNTHAQSEMTSMLEELG